MATSRQSIGRPVTVPGCGLHTGHAVTLTFRPAVAGEGLVFRRTDLPGSPTVPARLDAVRSHDRRTVLGQGSTTVETVEHVLAAAAALELDDLLIDLDGPEPPAGDGSAGPFFAALQAAGIIAVGGRPERRVVRQPFTLRDGASVYAVAPAARLTLTVTVEWDHPAIGRQTGRYEVTAAMFAEALADARTFGFLEERDALAARGLARGASSANTVLLTSTGVLDAGLRWPDEFVRHKAVDVLGDLALLGGRLAAAVDAFRPSHRGNLAVARAIDALPSEELSP